jgi:hypothetical protein
MRLGPKAKRVEKVWEESLDEGGAWEGGVRRGGGTGLDVCSKSRVLQAPK